MGWRVRTDGQTHRPLDSLLKEGRIKSNKVKCVRVWKSKQTTDRQLTRQDTVLVLSSLSDHVWLRRASYGWAKGFCIHVCVGVCTFGRIYALTLLSVLMGSQFFWWGVSEWKSSTETAHPASIQKKELVQFGSLYGVLASRFIRNNEERHSRCVNQRSVEAWRSSAKTENGWMWPGCSCTSRCKLEKGLKAYFSSACRYLYPVCAWCICSKEPCRACCKCLRVFGWRRQTVRTDVYVQKGRWKNTEDVIWRKQHSEETSSAEINVRNRLEEPGTKAKCSQPKNHYRTFILFIPSYVRKSINLVLLPAPFLNHYTFPIIDLLINILTCQMISDVTQMSQFTSLFCH